MAITSRKEPAIPNCKSDPVLATFAFAGRSTVSTQITPAATSVHLARRKVTVRMTEPIAVIDSSNAYEAMRFAQYLASQCKFVLDGGAT